MRNRFIETKKWLIDKVLNIDPFVADVSKFELLFFLTCSIVPSELTMLAIVSANNSNTAFIALSSCISLRATRVRQA